MALVDLGLLQGSIITCGNHELSQDIRDAICQGRAIPSHRNKLIQENYLLVILSQDCDIYNEQDHHLELVCIKELKNKDINTKAQKNRNYKKIQIPINGKYWLFEAELISIVPKAIIEAGQFRVSNQLPARELDIVLDWRVGRYCRKPLPNRFNQDFLIDYIKAPANEFGAYLEANYDVIDSLFVYVTPLNDEEADEYRVSVTALLYEECNDEKRLEIIGQIERHCRILHESENSLRMFQIDDDWHPTDEFPPLDYALKMSDFTFLDASLMRKLNLDYLCYPDDTEDTLT